MAEAIELKRPGIEILQVFEAVSPTVKIGRAHV